MAEIDSNFTSPSSKIDVPRMKEVEEDFSWLLVFRRDHHHDHRCSSSRRSSESSSSSSGAASSSSESCLPSSSASCSGDSGYCGVVASSSSSSLSSSECYSTSMDCNASESTRDFPDTLDESQPRLAEAVVSRPRGLNPYAAPFAPRQSFDRHLKRLKKRRWIANSVVEESWTDEDVGSHGDAFVNGEFEQEEKISQPQLQYGSSTEPTEDSEEAVKGRRGR